MTDGRSVAPLVALAFGAFIIGTAELVIVGILDLIARDTGVSISTAGQLVTGYALGIAFGAPLISAATARLGRRLVLRAALVAFLIGNLLVIAATGFGLLLIARVMSGSLHGVFVGAAIAIAAAIAPAERRGQAISLVVGGIAVSTVVGVPVGTLVGQALGWRAAFVAILALGCVALVITLRLVPTVEASAGLGAQARAALGPRVGAVLGLSVLIYSGQFTAFTYLTPFLREVTGVSGGMVSVYLLAFGIAATAGTLLGGRAADASATTTLLAANGVLVGALAALYVVGASPVLTTVALAAWGLAGFATGPALQLRAMSLAGEGGDLAATLGVSAINAGIALGSVIGGAVVGARGAQDTVLVAAALCAVALPLTWATNRIGRTARHTPTARAAVETA